jgi:methylenetetrahydrofolate dehydrogenase (NADP+)/methenyltetrahydrofolate cyclohydrolase
MATILDGKACAAVVRQGVAARVAALRLRGYQPGLVVVLVGEDPASQVYVRNKDKAAQEAGFAVRTLRLPADLAQSELEARVRALGADTLVHGILVQLPLPRGLDAPAVLRCIPPEKDVDGFHPVNAGLLFEGRRGLVPCTPWGCMRLLDHAGVDASGKNAVVLGRSNIVGKPAAMLLPGCQ